MKVAYVSIWDATDVRNWSGLDLNIWRAVAAAGADVELVGNLHVPRSTRRRVRKLWARYVERKQTHPFWDVDTARGLAETARQRLADVRADVILSPSPLPLAFLTDPRPKVVWTDATFAGLSATYPEFSPARLSRAAVRGGRAIDRAAARNATLVYASDWAAETAIDQCGADPRRVRTIPFGAIVEDATDDSAARDLSRPRLLFVGVDWLRKGGDKAVAVVARLRDRGLPATLTVVGCRPENSLPKPDFVEYVDFVDKTTAAGRARLADLYRASTFLIVPSSAEAYGLVFAEAAAFAVPSLSHRVGGIPTVVSDGVTGKLFDVADGVDAWADWVVAVVGDPVRYPTMAAAAFADARDRLNWTVAGRAMVGLLTSVAEDRIA